MRLKRRLSEGWSCDGVDGEEFVHSSFWPDPEASFGPFRDLCHVGFHCVEVLENIALRVEGGGASVGDVPSHDEEVGVV